MAGVDLDPSMLEAARAKAPELTWLEGDLADPDLLAGRRFEVVVLAGNVLIFLTPGTEGAVLANVSRLLVSGGRAIAGYSLRRGGFTWPPTTPWPGPSGLELEDRWSTWDGEPFGPDSTYAVSVHRKAIEPASRNGGQRLGDLTH